MGSSDYDTTIFHILGTETLVILLASVFVWSLSYFKDCETAIFHILDKEILVILLLCAFDSSLGS